jgi:hypothetical protein
MFAEVPFDEHKWRFIDGEALEGQEMRSLTALVPEGDVGVAAALLGKIRALFR